MKSRAPSRALYIRFIGTHAEYDKIEPPPFEDTRWD
jgi:mRNA-degrading endonuclease HigB of HigAB toxin-antitoxin module